MISVAWWWPLLGGALIGLAGALLWLLSGRVAGVSNIAGGLLTDDPGGRTWRLLFVLGLVIGGFASDRALPAAYEAASASPLVLIAGGLLVGIGTTLSNGCTSGHGVCGLSRFSPRSLAAVVTFMTAGMLTVYVVRHLLGGAP